jgi:uncharacterized protein DUF4349
MSEMSVEELERLLREEAPEPDPAFAEALRQRMTAGFPKQSKPKRRDSYAIPSRWREMAPLGAVASLILVLAVAVGLAGRGDNDESGDGGGGAAEVRQAAPDDSGASREAAPLTIEPAPPPGGGRGGTDFAPGRERRIERSAALTLSAPAGDLDEVADGIIAVTDRHGGYVLRSSVTSGEDGGGTFELRVPGARQREAIADLSRLGDVRSQTESGQDVTRAFVSARDRLDAARAERRSLLTRLEQAETDAEAESLRRRLDLVAGEIRVLRGQLRDLRLRTDYTAITVSLEAAGRESDGSLGAAADDFTDTLVGALALLLRALGVLIPLALVGGAAWLGARTLRRRRREAALI